MEIHHDMPAILGGRPLRPQGPPDWPAPDPDVQQALEAVYRSGAWGKYQGGCVAELESALAQFHQIDFALTCASGTLAVELALRALKIGSGAEVILAAYDYCGNFFCVHAVGAHPVLADVAHHHWNLDVAKLASAITCSTQAIIVSHLHGGLVPMREVMAIAAARGIPVIEDAAQATGAKIQGRWAGTWGDVGILSFGGSKLLTAGRGGALLTRDRILVQRYRALVQRGNHTSPLSELQAAVLLPQLFKLEARNDLRRCNAQWLAQLLADVPGIRTFDNRDREAAPSFYKFGWQFCEEQFGLTRSRFTAAVRAEGVALDEGFSALHVGRSPRRFRAVDSLSEATRAHSGAVVLHHPVLLGSQSDIEQVAAAIRKIRSHADQLQRR